jgi:hypothetical protein
LRIAYCVLRIAHPVASHAFLSLGRWTPGWGGTGAPSWAPGPTQPGVQLTSACISGPRRENTEPDYIYCAQRNSFCPVASHAYSHPVASKRQYAIRNTQYAIRRGLKAPIRNTQYAIRNTRRPQSANTQYAIRNTQYAEASQRQYAIRNTQYAIRRGFKASIRNTHTQYAIRRGLKAPIRNTQYAIRNTQGASRRSV